MHRDQSSPVVITLVDISSPECCCNYYYHLIQQKFLSQQIGKSTWLQNKLDHLKWIDEAEFEEDVFLPIEFTDDEDVVLHHLERFPYSIEERMLSWKIRQNWEIRIELFNPNEPEEYEMFRQYIESLEDIDEPIMRFFFVLMRLNYTRDYFEQAKSEFPKLFKWMDEPEICERVLNSRSYKFNKNLKSSGWKYFVEYCNPRIRGNVDIVKRIASFSSSVKKYLPSEVLTDKETILELGNLNDIPLGYWHDRSFVLDLTTRHSNNLLFLKVLPSVLLNDKEIVLRIVNTCHSHSHLKSLFVSLSDELKNDKEIVVAFLIHEPSLFIGGIPTHFQNREIVLELFNSNPIILGFIGDLLERNLIKNLLETSLGTRKAILPPQYRDDMELVKLVVKNNPSQMFQSVTHITRDQVLELVKINGKTLPFATNGWESLDYSQDEEILLEAIKQNGSVLSTVKKTHLEDELILEAIKSSGYSANLPFCEDLLMFRIVQVYLGAKIN